MNGSRTSLGRNLKEITINSPANITMPNQFAGLAEDMIAEEEREVVNIPEENKENGDAGLISWKSASHGKFKATSQKENRHGGKEEGNAGLKWKRADTSKPSGNIGMKPKLNKTNRPTRGLVIGQSREVTELSLSGKRLRVEKDSGGQRGGVFLEDRVGNSAADHFGHVNVGVSNTLRLGMEEDALFGNTVMQQDSPEAAVGTHEA